MKIAIQTWGCSANQNDTEILAGILSKAGYKLTSLEDADLIILNTCIVKHRVQIDELNAIKYYLNKNKKILVTGCMAQAKTFRKYLNNLPILGLYDQKNIVEIVKKIELGQKPIKISKKPVEKTNLPKLRKNPIVEICQISTGCLSSCTYCATKLAKGNLFSYAPEAILTQIECALKDGCKEIWLTSQDCGAYGLDKNTNIAELLEMVCNIQGDFLIRLGMANPQWLYKFKKELLEVYENSKIFKFLHIPVQSGSDKVLKEMHRGYTIKQFKNVISAFRKKFPKITISTDIICGYPTETEKDWEKTLNLINWLKPDVINISQFWPRPGTLAEKLKELPSYVKKTRSRKLTNLYHKIALEKNMTWLNWKGEVLIDEIGQKGGFVGRNFAYKPVVFKTSKRLKLGQVVKAKVISATKNHLVGEII
ncbi:MAG: tRNA (N(6)-L-threonylcarbamoyladenosine(37)-C(2))-methylthiotransferase [Candidatus Nanoarchaeia archaeon]